MRLLTWRGWILVVVVGVLSASVAFFGLLTVRQLLIERQQLREIVLLIQQGRIRVEPPPQATPPPAPPAKPGG